MIRDIRQQIWSRYARAPFPFPFERMMEQPATEYSPNSGVRSFDQVNFMTLKNWIILPNCGLIYTDMLSLIYQTKNPTQKL